MAENLAEWLVRGYSTRHEKAEGNVMALTEFQREAIKLKAAQTSQIGVAGVAVIGFGALTRILSGQITSNAILQAVGLVMIAYVFAIVMRQLAVLRLRALDEH